MSKVALVTGANQGLGLAIVQLLCQRLPPASTVYLGARSAERGGAAVKELAAQGFQSELMVVDVSSDESVLACATAIASKHGGIDFVVSNAAARMGDQNTPVSEYAEDFMNTNNYGLSRMLRRFMPILKDSGHFLCVASSFGSLTKLDPKLHGLFDVSKMSVDDVDASTAKYLASLLAGTAAEEGWPSWVNTPSKIAQVASIKITARDPQWQARGIRVNAVCPGLVKTDASKPFFDPAAWERAPSPLDASRPVVELLVGGGPEHGELMQFGKAIPWK